jgi:hypothetical protein
LQASQISHWKAGHSWYAKLFKDQKIASKDLELEPDQYNDALSLEEIPERELNYTKAFAYGGA